MQAYACTIMREWLSGGAPPCQGGGRGFDPRLALLNTKRDILGYLFLCLEYIRVSKLYRLRFAPVRAGFCLGVQGLSKDF